MTKRTPNGDLWRRFRVICSCTSPPVIVRRYYVPTWDPAPAGFMGDGLGREIPMVLHDRQWLEGGQEQLNRVPRGGNFDPELGLLQSKPPQWRCSKCGADQPVTVAQADEVARVQIAAGKYDVDLQMLVGRRRRD